MLLSRRLPTQLGICSRQAISLAISEGVSFYGGDHWAIATSGLELNIDNREHGQDKNSDRGILAAIEPKFNNPGGRCRFKQRLAVPA